MLLCSFLTRTVKSLEELLDQVEVNETMIISLSHLVALLQKPKGPFKGLEFYGSQSEANDKNTVPNSTVSVRLPRELDVGSDNTIATVRADVSMKIHISLAVALILLNLHFLPSQTVAAQASTGLCIYMALSLHYSLLATFAWMALEGFHVYILLVRVFNIYVKRYLLKLSVVGWGIPAVIVSLVAVIDRGAYGRVALDSSNPNSTLICYITNDTVKVVTTVGAFGLVFIFNMIMFGVTVIRVMSLRPIKEHGQSDRDRAKRDICTLLGVSTLLGITWGLVFFSFGYLTVAGLYTFCILNSLQGVFILLWFVMSLKKYRSSATATSSVTRSTNS
ncbi:hypothetical protein F2P81_025621 [Scophthalmus maximus]|uniref:G-protein coupled receptors family 2 profile 2 domain-containing protein n=1 Tax=Scophthalmus maximus TaxID=52904 RepID=A0A6A4RI31_SCOMX|nr:hypothetical protein F2P81_025621 [Scophthalmus maximus]